MSTTTVTMIDSTIPTGESSIKIGTEDKPQPTIYEFDASSTSSSELVAAICREGGVIVRNFASQSTLTALKQEVQPYLDADEGYDGEFFSKDTRKAQGLAARSPTFCKDILANDLWRGVYDAFLITKTKSWTGKNLHECVSRPQLSSSAVIAIHPGGKAQPLHRDDMVHHVNSPAVTADDYQIGRDTSVGLFVAGSKTTKKNGATRFQPRSHLQATIDPPNEEDTVYAELEPGDAFMMLASCYHGGSENKSVDEERRIYVHFMIKGYLRQVSARPFRPLLSF
jgi:ectoine hydroxylase-related dioxygenase (phytanoyl-CoA dioxygenase family)